jgi:serine/threonine protein kinase/DNA-binding winged helix-turn-helix (wHTH) protein
MEAAPERSVSLAFGRFRVFPRRRQLLADGRPIKLGGRAFDVLMALIEAPGAIVGEEALMARIWPDRVVAAANLHLQISALRAALEADGELIRTVAGRGYQFTGEIRSMSTGSDGRGGTGMEAAELGAILAPADAPEPISELTAPNDDPGKMPRFAVVHRPVAPGGSGDIGKARFALSVALQLLPHFAHGAWRAEISDVLWADSEHVFCRARREADDGSQTSVLALVPAAEHPAPNVLARLAHEHGLKNELDAPWAVRPLELIRDGGRLMLVLEDPGGELLESWLGRPMEPELFTRLALGLAEAVAQLHRRGLIHKDLKPAHILVEPNSAAVWLTGFGIASRLPRERPAAAPPEVIAGTLAYMAPELTGRMNRSVDARSDLYSVGVVLYRMLTGRLPFSASEPMEWVHCHIARKPVPPAEIVPAAPAALSAIAMKLLAKTAEERYQTAAGLAADLRHCLAAWRRDGAVAAFVAGEHDIPDQLRIPEKLYGREREIGTLLAAFERVVAQGKPELMLVAGYAGIGKSAVVSELHKVLVPLRGLFAAGKFDQSRRDMPYAPLAQAFQGLIRTLLVKSDTELTHWRDALRDALGPNGGLLVDLLPELTLIIGKPAPVPELPPQEAQRRFALVFRRFLGVFARAEHPLVLFLDDLQWPDPATLDLLVDLLTQPEVRHLLLIGAYRDNEVDPAHPLARKLTAVRQAGTTVEEIALAPLTREDVRQLIADTLRCRPEQAGDLAHLVHGKTGGNPFFVIQFLSTLAEEGLLAFEQDDARWS